MEWIAPYKLDKPWKKGVKTCVMANLRGISNPVNWKCGTPPGYIPFHDHYCKIFGENPKLIVNLNPRFEFKHLCFL